ncbi:MAG: TonB-dependent receptor [Gemmatimonadales bacterium]|nr:TonB-dependent receptor [Gemmatimonadales bacterium]
MTSSDPGSSPRIAAFVVAICLASASLQGQERQSPSDSVSPPDGATAQQIEGHLLDALPIDRVVDGLLLLPGTVGLGEGDLALRGGTPGSAALYLDGLPITPGFRRAASTSLVGNLAGFSGAGAALGVNGLETVFVRTGAASVAFGNGQDGVVELITRTGGDQWGGSLSYESDEPFGVNHGLGLNRVQAAGGGPLGSRARFFFAGVLQGQKSAPSGPGSEGIPLFAAAGVDTTVAVPSSFLAPSDTTFVDVTNFAVARGSCDAFSESPNPDIASNYSFDCAGVRIPTSTRSSYEALAKLSFRLSPRSQISLTALTSQGQSRNFDYQNLYNPQQLGGNSARSQVYALSYALEPGVSSSLPLGFEAQISYQTDRFESGPLSEEGEVDSRDPFGGYLISPLDFRFGFDEFPIDDQLVENYRDNILGSRRTPYDLENRDQFNLIDIYRNNAYGVLGFSEAGGPIGRLRLFEEDRVVGRGALIWAPDERHTVRVGGEFARYSISNYSHELTSQAFSDVYIEKPVRFALFAEDQLSLGDFRLVGGIRFDRFNSRAERPYLLDLDQTSPTFDQYIYFPRTSTYQGTAPDGRELTQFVADEAHGAVSPSLQIGYRVSDRVSLRASAARRAQVPDFEALLLGINTDIQLSALGQTFGTDLEFEKTDLAEVGLRYTPDPETAVDVAVFVKDRNSLAIGRSVPLIDPARNLSRDVRLVTNDGKEDVKGVELRIDRRWGDILSGFVGYSYQDVESARGFERATTRPHTVAGALALAFPMDWREGSVLGTIFQGIGVYTAFRFASGTAYSRCPRTSGNESILSGDVCVREFDGEPNGSRLPSTKQLDLRITKGFTIGRSTITAYVDARNLLHFDNIQRVFATTGTTQNAEEALLAWRSDSAQYFNEAWWNGWLDFGTGTIDLTFGTGQPDQAGMCGSWANQAGTPSAPNCVYLIRAEQRFGNGDGMFEVAEQRAASTAFYNALRGAHNFTGSPRRVRIGLQIGF